MPPRLGFTTAGLLIVSKITTGTQCATAGIKASSRGKNTLLNTFRSGVDHGQLDVPAVRVAAPHGYTGLGEAVESITVQLAAEVKSFELRDAGEGTGLRLAPLENPTPLDLDR